MKFRYHLPSPLKGNRRKGFAREMGVATYKIPHANLQVLLLGGRKPPIVSTHDVVEVFQVLAACQAPPVMEGRVIVLLSQVARVAHEVPSVCCFGFQFRPVTTRTYPLPGKFALEGRLLQVFICPFLAVLLVIK